MRSGPPKSLPRWENPKVRKVHIHARNAESRVLFGGRSNVFAPCLCFPTLQCFRKLDGSVCRIRVEKARDVIITGENEPKKSRRRRVEAPRPSGGAWCRGNNLWPSSTPCSRGPGRVVSRVGREKWKLKEQKTNASLSRGILCPRGNRQVCPERRVVESVYRGRSSRSNVVRGSLPESSTDVCSPTLCALGADRS